jgi:beta-glucanase (GH16 family)
VAAVIRRSICLLAALCVVVATLGACEPAPPPGTLVFREEFNGATLSSARWHPNRWFSSVCSVGATPGERQLYRPAHAFVRTGVLVLKASAGADTCSEGTWSGTRSYTSGWAQSGGARTPSTTKAPGELFRFGRVEVRFKAPKGGGLWPAVWLLSPGTKRSDGSYPYPSRPEIDGVEIFGDRPDLWQFNVHLTTPGGTKVDKGSTFAGPDASAGWHVIAVDWRSDKITWLVDGVPRWTYTGPGIPQVPLYVIVNLAVGGTAGTPDPAAFPAELKVDYIRIRA